MIRWSELEKPWQAAFEQAWESYCKGSVPIGAALVDKEGTVIAAGRSMQYEKDAVPGQITWSKLSHAELNTLLQVSAHDHPNIRGCTLYTTAEPCPLCFGALVMSNVRSLKYAARDAWAGSANLLHANGYISSKPIVAEGPFEQLEILSMALSAEHFLRNGGTYDGAIIKAWEKDCPEGVWLGREWNESGWLEALARKGAEVDALFKQMPYFLSNSTERLD